MGLIGRLRARRLDDRGVSLAELLVTIMIFGIVLTVVTSTFISLTRVTSQANATDQNVRQASNGIDELSRQIRGAVTNPVPNAADSPAFSLATTESMTFSTAVNLTGSTTQPQQAAFSLAADRSLVETKTASVVYQSSYWRFTGAVSKRTLTGPVSTTAKSGTPLFQYFDASSVQLVPNASGALTATQMQQIASITVSLNIRSSKVGDTGVSLVNTVGMPNLTSTGTVS